MSAGDGDSGKRRVRGEGSDLAGDPRTHSPEQPPPPLDRLDPERLADFLELALPPDDLLRLCRKIGVNSPGYRIDKLSPPERAALLADEYAHEKKSQPTIEEAVWATLKTPALRTMWLTAPAARELAQLLSGDPLSAAARLAWRCIGDGDPAVRRAAERAIDAGLALLEDFEDAAEVAPTDPDALPSAPNEDLLKRVARAEHDRESARALLQQARAEIAERDRRVNGLKGELGSLRLEQAQQVAELSRLHASRSTVERRDAHEQRKVAAERAHLEQRVVELEERLMAERRRAAELSTALANERERERLALNQPPGPEPEPEGAPANDFVVPHFTDEFYDSLIGWDRRITRTAFEKVMLLARDRRHPSLRALPLEGADNYFRIRIASDVRLIYRRAADGRLEIRALIDREDLERYIRQAKTRPES